ncbi:MAG TPA: hypothetical protein VH374_26280 [Polyangia bacterium]|jgi:hypothetical protein|nr:hypothetical protein [Polyangia bacterium]
MDDVANSDPCLTADPRLQQLHQLALTIAALRQQFGDVLNNTVANADADEQINGVDVGTVLTQLAQSIATEVGIFSSLRSQIDATTAAQCSVGPLDQAILDVGSWAQQMIQVLPSALAAVPNALVNALGTVVTNAGQQTAKALVWPAIIVVGAIGLAALGERTRTGRAASTALVRRIA